MQKLLKTALVLTVSLGAGCAANPKALIRDGEAALSARHYDQAATAFKEAQLTPGITKFDRDAAELGEVKAFLGKSDLVGAETRLRRMSDQRSDKWYYLGEIAAARKQRDVALAAYRKALERTHGGDTANKVALLIAGEARRFEAFLEAAKVLKGDRAQSEALREAASVWRALLAGNPAPKLLERLAPGEEALASYPAARVLKARLLEAAGNADEARAAWDLSTLTPPPSPAFLKHAKELRARLAIERGDSSALSTVLEGADVGTAGRVRGDLATARLWRGDVEGALVLWRETAKAGGDPAPDAAARIATHLERLGRSDDAQPFWKQAATALGGPGSTPFLRRALAHRMTRKGDLLGACDALGGEGVGDAMSPETRRAQDLRRAGELLREALDAHGREDDAQRDRLARAVLLVTPLEPVSLELLGIAIDGAPDAEGLSKLEHQRTQLIRHLRRGEAAEARAVVRWWKQQRVDATLSPPALAAFGETLEEELHAGLRRALAAGLKEDAQDLLGAAGLEPTSKAASALRACACLTTLSLPGPRGLAALPKDQTVWGSLVVPAVGLRLARVGILRKGPGWTLTVPGGSVQTYASRDALEAGLGGSVESAEWTELLDPYDLKVAEGAAWRERRAAWPRVEVR